MTGKEISQPDLSGQEDLEKIIQSLGEGNTIALDTEFERRRTFYPIPALLQFSDHHQVTLIDPLSCNNLDGLFTALNGKTVIMHACREDMEVLRVLSPVKLTEIQDTQIAAALLGFEPQISYQKLVESILGRQLPKDETCSDWLARPLSDTQLQYAIDDVVYLFEVYETLVKRLKDLGRYEWFQQEMLSLTEFLEEPALDEYFHRIKGAGRFSREQLSTLYELVVWREKKVRNKNIPRGFLIKDRGLIEIARHISNRKPDLKNDLAGNKEVPPKFTQRFAREVNELLANQARDELDEAASCKYAAIEKVGRELPIKSKHMSHEIKSFRNKVASELELKPEVLLSNKLIKQFMEYIYFENREPGDFEQEVSQLLSPWRYQQLRECLEIYKSGPVS